MPRPLDGRAPDGARLLGLVQRHAQRHGVVVRRHRRNPLFKIAADKIRRSKRGKHYEGMTDEEIVVTALMKVIDLNAEGGKAAKDSDFAMERRALRERYREMVQAIHDKQPWRRHYDVTREVAKTLKAEFKEIGKRAPSHETIRKNVPVW